MGLFGGVALGSNPVGWAILGVVAIAGTAVTLYHGEQWYQNQQSSGGSATATQYNSYAYAQNDYAARLNGQTLAQACAQAQQASAIPGDANPTMSRSVA
ncbi:hypothetical protein [Actinoplanes sp. NPDC049802]|uniref:hypothetical protein n=1 Tax=Actinoplanes sp. NPDC049802 TaxID=3154742 RepID=UPI0033CC1632